MGVLQDLRFAVRMLLKERWFTAMASLVLALGIGANNAVFTLVNAVLLRGLPFNDSNQIVIVSTRDTRGRNSGVSLLDFEDWRSSARSFAGLSFVFSGSFNVSDEGRLPEQYPGPYVSANFFKMLGVAPVLGRDFTPEDDGRGGPPVVMLGHSIWEQRYGSDPGVLGRTIRLNGVNATIIGVMPDGMKFPFEAELWLPTSQLAPAIRDQPRQARGYTAIGRLANGVTLEQAQAELTTIGARLASTYPETNKDLAPHAEVFAEATNGGQLRLIFLSLMGAVVFVLLIACANVANLLLAKAARRSNEISVRVALGASRWQVVRQLLIESVLLSLLAGVVGLVLSIAAIRWFDGQTQNVGRPYWIAFTMDWRTFLFFFAVSTGTGVIFGLAPALHVSRTNVNEMLKEGGRTGSSGIRARRWTAALIVAEVALTLILLAGAGFMMRSFLSMYRMEPGFETSRLLTMNMILPARKYPSLEDRNTFLQRIEEHLSASADIEAVSTTTNPPLSGGGTRRLEIDGRATDAEQRPTVTILSIGPRYFDTLGLHAVQGRTFTTADGQAGREGAIVNERLVALYFKGENPIGRRIRLAEERPTGPAPGWATVIGVVPNVLQRRENAQQIEPDAVAYVPHLQNGNMARGALLLARVRSNSARAGETLRQEIRAVDPDMALFNVRTMDDLLTQQRWPFRVFGTMFSTFALIALVLSALGLYAVTSYSVAQYAREIGVRMVLGAQPVQVIWLFLRRGFIQLGIGLALGFAGAMGVGRLLQSLLVRTSPRDPVTLTLIVALLTTVGVVACIWPARRATRLDPVVVLRHE